MTNARPCQWQPESFSVTVELEQDQADTKEPIGTVKSWAHPNYANMLLRPADETYM